MTSELYKELIDLLIKKDWLYHTESMIKIYSDLKENSDIWFYSHISNLIYDDKKVMIGFINDTGIIKYF
jgi:hypothetical protein